MWMPLPNTSGTNSRMRATIRHSRSCPPRYVAGMSWGSSPFQAPCAFPYACALILGNVRSAKRAQREPARAASHGDVAAAAEHSEDEESDDTNDDANDLDGKGDVESDAAGDNAGEGEGEGEGEGAGDDGGGDGGGDGGSLVDDDSNPGTVADEPVSAPRTSSKTTFTSRLAKRSRAHEEEEEEARPDATRKHRREAARGADVRNETGFAIFVTVPDQQSVFVFICVWVSMLYCSGFHPFPVTRRV